MNSTLTLIYGSQVLPERNFKVPSLDDIVSKAEATTVISNFMYVKHAMDLTIKINKSQLTLTFDKASTNNLNYVIIQNISDTTQKKVGYFVIDKKWIAESTIELTLHCDVVNTFIDDCELSDKTKIIRQHKDRYEIDNSDFDRITNVQVFEPTHDEATWGISSVEDIETGVILYDLTMAEPYYTDNGEYVYPYVLFRVNEFIDARIYAVDENYRVIEQLATFLPYLRDTYVRIGMGQRPVWKVESFGSDTPFPSGTKYLALRYTLNTPEEYENANISISPQGYDELEEAQQLELQSTMLCYINKFGQYHEKSISTRYVRPKIDFYSEGIQPQLYGLFGGMLEEEDVGLKQNWYLIYRNQNDPSEILTNPVDVFLCGEQDTYIEQMTKTTSAQYNWEEMIELFIKMNGVANITQLINLRERYGLFIPYALNYGTGTGEIEITGHNNLGATTKTFSVSNSSQYLAIAFDTYQNIPVIWTILFNSYGEQLYASFWVEDDFRIEFTDMIKATIGTTAGAYNEVAEYPVSSIFATGTGTASIVGISSINRTDAKLIKILKLPYCPANVSTAEGTGYLIYDTTQWEYDGVMQMLKLKKFNTFFNRWLKFDHNPLEPLKPLLFGRDFIVNSEDERSILNEPKLYHSDFYYEKYFYDSFGFAFQLEYVQNYVSTFNVSFQVSNTINSRFLFTFQGYQVDKYLKDFNNIMYIARNNEIAIFNQQYINYIRTGYNYDVKSLQLTEEQIYRQEMLSGISGAGNLAISGANALTKLASSKNASAGSSALAYISQASGFATSTLGMLYNDAYTIQQSELSLQGKMTQLRNQSTGVIDANDVDLMSYYSGNRLRYLVYRCSEKMRVALWKLFFYTGYVADIQGIPDTTSRLWFNFVQADVQFKKVPNLPASYITELKQKFMEGITFLHKNNNKIDFDQQYENWETKFFEE